MHKIQFRFLNVGAHSAPPDFAAVNSLGLERKEVGNKKREGEGRANCPTFSPKCQKAQSDAKECNQLLKSIKI